MLILDGIRARYYRFIFDGLMHRNYEILLEKVDILERENALQKRYIQYLEGEAK